MKTEIKALYKQNPKLAKEVAKVLGYKIKVQAGYKNQIKDLVTETVVGGLTEDIEYADEAEGKTALKYLKDLVNKLTMNSVFGRGFFEE